MTRIGYLRVTKAYWYRCGGFKNSDLFRRQTRGGGWRYFVILF